MQNTTIRKKSILFIKNAILFPAGVFDFWAIERKPLLLKTPGDAIVAEPIPQ